MTDESLEFHSAHVNELNNADFYKMLKLRIDVFVVEQQRAYHDLDLRDLEDSTVHHWISQGDEVVCYLRVLQEPKDVVRIGRVCTAYNARSKQVARALMQKALESAGNKPVEVSAESHLAAWFESLGFEITGSQYFELGIPHVPMRKS